MTLADEVRPVEAEALRLISEGRVSILRVTKGQVYSKVYAEVADARPVPFSTGWTTRGWWCSCRSAESCAHVIAVRLVCADEDERADFDRTAEE